MLNLLRKDYKELVSNKKIIWMILLVLIIFIISTNYNAKKPQETNPVSKIQFALTNSDNSPYSKLLIEYFKESESFSSYINVVEGDREKLLKQFQQAQFDVYLEIPENFANNLMVLEHQPVKVLINSKDPVKAVLIKNLLESYETYISAVEINCVGLYEVMSLTGMDQELIYKKNYEISLDLIFTALGKEAFFHYQEISDYPSTSVRDYYFYAFLVMAISYGALYVGYQMMKEKNLGTFSRLHTIGLSTYVIVLEKVLFSALLLILTAGTTYLIAYSVTGNTLPLKLISIIFLTVLFYISLAIFLSSIFRNVQNYMIAGNLMYFLFSIIGGGIIPIQYLPEVLKEMAKLTPNYWIEKVCLLIQKGIVNSIYGKFLIGIGICSVIFILLSIAFYNREEVRLDD
ncbi:ABC transporter permease [Anaerocolumna sp.]|uniref:ABC transporter permease n=1 Tax=Anaerocolumna sp. TaxID=2041569 RepID=UPI0028A5BB2E|nr:ABC transporter permease [Anaerocolumna sp.]